MLPKMMVSTCRMFDRETNHFCGENMGEPPSTRKYFEMLLLGTLGPVFMTWGAVPMAVLKGMLSTEEPVQLTDRSIGGDCELFIHGDLFEANYLISLDLVMLIFNDENVSGSSLTTIDEIARWR